MINAVLLADLTQVNDEITFASVPCRILFKELKSGQLRAGTNHEDFARLLATPVYCNMLVTLICCDDDFSSLECKPLKKQQRPINNTTCFIEFDAIHFG